MLLAESGDRLVTLVVLPPRSVQSVSMALDQ